MDYYIYYDNDQMFINEKIDLSTGEQNFGSHDRPHYYRTRIITRDVVTRANCGSFD